MEAAGISVPTQQRGNKKHSCTIMEVITSQKECYDVNEGLWRCGGLIISVPDSCGPGLCPGAREGDTTVTVPLSIKGCKRLIVRTS